MGMGRRAALRGAVATIGALVTAGAAAGCGPSEQDIAADLRRAAEDVDGVTSVEATLESGAEFESGLRGVVSVDAADRAGLLSIFDEALGAVVRRIAEAGYSEHMDLKGLVGRSAAGEATVFDLDPTLTPDNRRIRARLLFERYGVA